jgi:hypothetical protein
MTEDNEHAKTIMAARDKVGYEAQRVSRRSCDAIYAGRVGRDARTVLEPPGHDRSHRRCDKARTAIGRAGASCGGAARGKQTAQCSGLNAHKSDFGRVIRLTMTPRHRIAYIQLCTTWKVAAFAPAHGRGFFSQRPEFRMFFAELFSRRLPPTPRNEFADSVAAADAAQ